MIRTALTTFLLVFFAELGDKTQIAALSMAANNGRMLEVFVGASHALVASTLLAVFLGRFVAAHVHPLVLKRTAALLFIGTGLWLLARLQGL